MKTLKSLTELYDHIVLNEASKSETAITDKTNLSKPSEMEVGDLKTNQEFFGEKPKAVEGAEKAKGMKELKYKMDNGSTSKPTNGSFDKSKGGFKGEAPAKDTEAEEPEETEEKEDVFPERIKKQKHEESYTMSAFENLLRKTLAEDLEEETAEDTSMEDTADSEDLGTEEMDEEGVDEEGMEEDEEGDLLSDLKDLQDKVADIISKLEGAAEENEEGESEEGEYTEDDFDSEFGEEGEEEAAPFKESVKAKSLSPSTGKKLMSKGSNKVGRLKAHGGKAHGGSLKNEPKPKALGDKKGTLQKGIEAKSSVKKGEFFK